MAMLNNQMVMMFTEDTWPGKLLQKTNWKDSPSWNFGPFSVAMSQITRGYEWDLFGQTYGFSHKTFIKYHKTRSGHFFNRDVANGCIRIDQFFSRIIFFGGFCPPN